jgi:hypothetical protein
MYRIHTQFLDLASGFHVIELRDERGHRHLLQLAIGHTACPACGAVQPKDNLGALDPAVAVASVNEALNTSQRQMLAYAEKHGLALR